MDISTYLLYYLFNFNLVDRRLFLVKNVDDATYIVYISVYSVSIPFYVNRFDTKRANLSLALSMICRSIITTAM
jgi:hypothetical protein